jgi:hypothetical protein
VTLSRTVFVLLASLGAGHHSTTHAQLVPNPDGGPWLVLPVTVNAAETRVPFSMQGDIPEFYIRATYGSNFYYCTDDPELGGVLNPARLQQRLVGVVDGKTAAQLGSLLTQITAAPNRWEKLRLIFGFNPDQVRIQAPTSGTWVRSQNEDYRTKLRMGQEARLWGPNCYTVDQADQIIAEGVRVIQAVAQALPQGPGRAPARNMEPKR